MSFQQFIWKGEPIVDIEAWAAERGERMIKYSRTQRVANIFTGTINKVVTTGRMPESFYNQLRIGGDVDECYEVLK